MINIIEFYYVLDGIRTVFYKVPFNEINISNEMRDFLPGGDCGVKVLLDSREPSSSVAAGWAGLATAQ